MSTRGDARVRAGILAALRRRRCDALDLLEALRTVAAPELRRREGGVHALLRQALRSGEVLREGTSPRGLPLYRLPEEEAAPEAPLPSPPPVPAEPASPGREARLVASALPPGPEAEQVALEVEAHLRALAAAGGVAAFGPPKAARALLARADRGRGILAFPRGPLDHLVRIARSEGPWIVGAVAAYLLVQAFLVEVFYIPSGSMLPTLREHDRVAVLKPGGRRVPERFSVITYRRHGQTYVKRCVGLPGERFSVHHGDLYADGRLLVKPDALREALRQEVGAYDPAAGAQEDWESREHPEGGLVLVYRHPLWVPGSEDRFRFAVRDLYLEARAERPAGGAVDLVLERGPPVGSTGERAIWTLEVSDAGVRLLEERRRVGEDPDEPFGGARGSVEVLAAGPARAGALDLGISLVDGVLRARAGSWGATLSREAPDHPARPRLRVVGPARLLEARLARDLHYSNQHVLAVQQDPSQVDPDAHAFRIPEGAIFCLGDNTANSQDSRAREVAEIGLDELVGPVVLRVWPPGRLGPVR